MRNTNKASKKQSPASGANVMADAPPAFVESLEKASDEGFSRVSKEWFEKTIPVERLAAAFRDAAEECLDYWAAPCTLRVKAHNGGARLVAEAVAAAGLASNRETLEIAGEMAGDGFALSDFGLRSLAGWVGVPAAAARKLAEHAEGGDGQALQILADFLNWGAAQPKLSNRDTPLRIRTRGTAVRAILSADYAPIPNAWLMDLFETAFPGSRVSHRRGDEDDVSGLLLLPDTMRSEPDSDYGLGVHFGNSEVGRSALRVQPAVYRAICRNGCVWGHEQGLELEVRHRSGEQGVDLDELAKRVCLCISEFLPVASKGLDAMLAGKAVVLAHEVQTISLIDVLGSANGMSGRQRVAWAEGWAEEGADTNAFGVVNGLSRSARDLPDNDAVALETLAATLADRDGDWWQSRAEEANDLDNEVLVDRYGKLVAQFV